MEHSAISISYDLDNEYMLVFEGVPAWVCRQCGDSFVGISVVNELERIVVTARKDVVMLGFIEYREAA